MYSKEGVDHGGLDKFCSCFKPQQNAFLVLEFSCSEIYSEGLIKKLLPLDVTLFDQHWIVNMLKFGLINLLDLMRSHPDWTTPKKHVPGQVKVLSIMPAANGQEVRWSVIAGGSLFLQAELKWKLWDQPGPALAWRLIVGRRSRTWVFLMLHFELPSVKASTENKTKMTSPQVLLENKCTAF